MADRKDSELTIKSTIVDGDLIPLLDSETAVDDEKNKTVAASTIKEYAAEATQSSGTWTVTSASGGPTLTGTFGRFVKTGIMVVASFQFTVPANSDASQLRIETLPFTPVSSPIVMGISTCVDTGVIIEYHNVQTNVLDQLAFFAVSGNATTDWSYQDAATFFVKGSITYITDEF